MIGNRITPYVELEKCAGCKKPFRTGDVCWALNYRGEAVMYSCSNCWKNILPKSLHLLDKMFLSQCS